MIEKVTCLAGGVGAAKFLRGLIEIIPQEKITVIVNTADDIELHGLHISPDLDIIMYTLAGLVDEEKGWGIQGDTFNGLNMFHKYGLETWFKLGDKDLATHIFRTNLLKTGSPLDEITLRLCESLGIRARILPVTNEKLASQIVTEAGKIHFEEYLVKREAKDRVLDVIIEGKFALPAAGVIEAIREADGVIVCPSNPIVSIGPILEVRNVREALKNAAKVIAISPIVQGATIKGPADKLMRGLGLEVSAYSVAYLYQDFLDVFIFDEADIIEREKIEALGMKAITTDTVMQTLENKVNLARLVLEALE